MYILNSYAFRSLLTIAAFFLTTCTDDNPIVPDIDHVAPVIEWLSPSVNADLAGTVELSFSVEDENTVSSVRVYRNGSVPDGWTLSAQESETYTLEWNTEEVDDGVYTLEVRATDDSGNLGISPGLQVRVDNHVDEPVDRLPPDVWWTAPDAGSTLSDTVTLTLGIFDEVGVDSVALYKNGALSGSGVPAEGEYYYAWNTLNDSDGVYVWEAHAWDAASNMGFSTSLLLRVQNHEPPAEDRTPPVLRWLSPLPGDTLDGQVMLSFEMIDDVEMDSSEIYLNGRLWQAWSYMESYVRQDIDWNTEVISDGIYLVQIKAYDSSLNIGHSEVISFYILNNRPRVIWVPDDYEKIQEAINASQNGDTVRVRAGTYEEGIWLMGKNIWLESEEGPEVTWIKGTGWNDGIAVFQLEHVNTTIVRGFKFSGSLNAVRIDVNSGLRLNNCIIDQSEFNIEDVNGIITNGISYITNCVIRNADWGFAEGYSAGDFRNNIIINCNTGYFGWATNRTYQKEHHNLYWNNLFDVQNRVLDETNLFDDPQFSNNSYILGQNSPAIDAGDPTISDLDGTRSDIGLYGGPYSY